MGFQPTSSPGHFSLALEVGLQSRGNAPWGRGWFLANQNERTILAIL